MFKKTKTKFM